MKAFSRIGALAMAIGTIVCCSAERAPATGGARGPQARVELDLFSGRPNPAWVLSAADARTLQAMLESLSPRPALEQASGLGYRGFVVKISTDTGEAATVRAYKGIVRQDIGALVAYRHDAERQIEKWLLQTGRPTLDPQTYEIVRKEVTSNEKH